MAHDPKNPRTQANLTDGDRRRDYGPAGCAGIVLAPVVLVAALLLRGGRR
ncbi:MAG: hypothetical protein WBA97_34315 [Actinophytocola sp.]